MCGRKIVHVNLCLCLQKFGPEQFVENKNIQFLNLLEHYIFFSYLAFA